VTVLFIPGFMQRGDAWRPVAERVAQSYRSACLDFAGWTFDERLEEIGAAAPPGAVLAGYSMGGRLALHAALRDPDRYSALVLVGASAGIEDEPERAERRAADDELAAWMERSSIGEVVARWESRPPFATQAPELVEAQRPARLSHDPRLLARLLRTAGQGAVPPVWDALGILEMPLLAVAGERDSRYARAAQRIAVSVPRGEARLVPGAGHAPQLEAPDAVAEVLLAFLRTSLMPPRRGPAREPPRRD
jgi:2-succinyl-6-hydroxy-2,4-cyclohexadiene-1-carboxylate synthase